MRAPLPPVRLRNVASVLCTALLLAQSSSLPLHGETPAATPAASITLPPNARVALIGDSITEQKLYSIMIESYLLACAGRKDVQCFNFGWSGEMAMQFKNRLENDLSAFNPDVATLCYGMNDAQYQPFNPKIGESYHQSMRTVLTGLQKVGVKHIVTGTPGAVDTHYYKKNIDPAVYNDSLAKLAGIDRELAVEFETAFADIHQPMMDVMARAKAARGPQYDVCGMDGVHPQMNGHLLMAEGFLKALGCTGDIGTYTLDMKGPAPPPAATRPPAPTAGPTSRAPSGPSASAPKMQTSPQTPAASCPTAISTRA